MHIGPLEYLQDSVLAQLAGVQDDLFRRMAGTACYAFLTAALILVVGLLVDGITLIPLFTPFLPQLLVFLIAILLAVRTVRFDAPSPGLTLAAGAAYYFLLLAANAFFQLANYFWVWGYVVFLLAMTLVIAVVYWFYTDFYIQMIGPYRA